MMMLYILDAQWRHQVYLVVAVRQRNRCQKLTEIQISQDYFVLAAQGDLVGCVLVDGFKFRLVQEEAHCMRLHKVELCFTILTRASLDDGELAKIELPLFESYFSVLKFVKFLAVAHHYFLRVLVGGAQGVHARRLTIYPQSLMLMLVDLFEPFIFPEVECVVADKHSLMVHFAV